MAERAAQRIAVAGLGGRIRLVVAPAAAIALDERFDALLLSFTQDVLQSPAALARLMVHARPGARVAAAGMCFVPWWWGAPVNLFNAYRARRYMTTFRGLRRPWRGLEAWCPDLVVDRRYLCGSIFRVRGTVAPQGARPPAPVATP
jgi:hypothetical protein